jgi:hypothetical protein
MKALNRVLLVVFTLVIIISLIPLALPTNYSTERSTVIEQPVEVVFAQISGFQNRMEWDPWLETEPTAKVTIEGPTHGIGAKYSWNGEKIGEGWMAIKEVKKNQMVKSELNFAGMGASDIYWFVEATEKGTKVTWRMADENLEYFERYAGLFMDQMMEKSFNKGLANLKTFTESLPVTTEPAQEPAQPAEEIKEEINS